jgi:hypothetical protein
MVKRYGLLPALGAVFRPEITGGTLLGLIAAVIATTLALDRYFPGHEVAVALGILVVALPLAYASVRGAMAPLLSMFHALSGTVMSYKDGDYSFGLHWPRKDEIGDLVDAHNALGQVLRDQRLELIRRELLLDTMVQNTPVAMLLVADRGPIVFAFGGTHDQSPPNEWSAFCMIVIAFASSGRLVASQSFARVQRFFSVSFKHLRTLFSDARKKTKGGSGEPFGSFESPSLYSGVLPH